MKMKKRKRKRTTRRRERTIEEAEVVEEKHAGDRG
jgi:hypothetical protein